MMSGLKLWEGGGCVLRTCHSRQWEVSGGPTEAPVLSFQVMISP